MRFIFSAFGRGGLAHRAAGSELTTWNFRDLGGRLPCAYTGAAKKESPLSVRQ
jgi:hypothetical protein